MQTLCYPQTLHYPSQRTSPMDREERCLAENCITLAENLFVNKFLQSNYETIMGGYQLFLLQSMSKYVNHLSD